MFNLVSLFCNDMVVGWDFEFLLDVCNDLNLNESDDMLIFEQGYVIEILLVLGGL